MTLDETKLNEIIAKLPEEDGMVIQQLVNTVQFQQKEITRLNARITDYGWEETRRHAERTGGWM